MTQLVAIPCKDAVVVATDGLSYDTDTETYTRDTEKVFQLTDDICLLIGGMDLHEPQELVKSIQANVDYRNMKVFDDIVTYLRQLISSYEWDEGSFITLFVVGYDKSTPRVYVVGISDDASGEVNRYADGSWPLAREFLSSHLNDKTYKKISAREAEEIATRIILSAEQALPNYVGGQQQIWHIKKSRIDKKSISYVEALRKKLRVV